jgi:hypothetical protein
VDSVTPVQVVEGQSLVKHKATAIKAVIRKTGTGTANNVSVQLTYGSTSVLSFSVEEPANMDAQNALISNNNAYPLFFDSNEVTKTIYFFSESLTPTSNTFQASVTVDYVSSITETDESNNTTSSTSVNVHDTKWSGSLFPNLYIHYFRTDWGNTPLDDFDSYFQASNGFLEGVYPVSEQGYTPDRSSRYVGNTTRFRGSDGELSEVELGL